MVYPLQLDVMLWVCQSLDQGAIIGEQQQAFAIAVQAARGVHVWHINILLQRRMTRAFISELRKHTIRLIENNIAHISEWDYNTRHRDSTHETQRRIR